MRLYIKKSLSEQGVFVGILVLLVMLLFGAESAICQAFFMGEVLSVDEDNMEIVLHPQYGIPVSEAESAIKTIHVRIAEVNSLPWDGETNYFPRCVIVGRTIRLWGQKMPGETDVFLVTDIRGCLRGGCSDPTGVRLRLLQRRQETRYPDNKFDAVGQESGGKGFDGSGHGERGGNGANGGNGGGGNGGGGGR